MGNTKFRKLISGEIRKALRKKNLNEGYAWERQPGQPLPTMEDVANAYNNKPKKITETIRSYDKKLTVEQMLQVNIKAFKSWCSDNDVKYNKISKEQVLNIVLNTLIISAESEALAEALDVDFMDGDLMDHLKKLGAYIDEDDNNDYLDER